jgi:hypothetical protein
MRDKGGKAVPIVEWSWPNTDAYRRKLVWGYRFPLTLGRALLRPLSFVKPVGKMRQRLKARRAALDLLLYYVDIYSPYTHLDPRYHTRNTAGLWQSLTAEDQKLFPFDIRGVDWRDYIANIHIPGLKKRSQPDLRTRRRARAASAAASPICWRVCGPLRRVGGAADEARR